tara:strand:- start:2 stop:226 length:225 start_codon:yes stop_codon:yes gene_type:complete
MMSGRRDFLKMITMASMAAVIPISSTPKKLTIPLTTGDSDMRIGVNGVERMRIYSSGNVGIGCINPSYKLKLNV